MADASCIGARAAISIAAATATMEDILLGLPFILVLYFMFGNVLLVLVCLGVLEIRASGWFGRNLVV